MLTVKQIAERLSISRSLAYRMVRNGEIPSYKIANCRRVSEDDLQEYLKRSQAKKIVDLPRATGKHF